MRLKFAASSMLSSRSLAPGDTAGGAGRRIGQYQPLLKYLRDRYADRLVLTFEQVEDVLGFKLPPDASTESGWWSVTPGADATPQSEAWTVANRTAVVNLRARNVLFERIA